MLSLLAAGAVAFTSPSSRGRPPARAFANGGLGEPRCLAALPRCRVVAFDSGDPNGEPILEPGTILEPPRSALAPLDEGGAPLLDDGAIERLFREFDTSGDGLISLAELRAGLSKAGAAVGPEAAEEILRRVDANADGQISAEEFRAVFRLSAESVPEGLRPLTAAAGFFLDSIGRVSDALGVDVPGQWRTTAYGARYVDDVIGGGELVVRGDVAAVHYTVTLMSTEAVVETSRGGPPLAFRVGDPAMGEEQGWTDAVDGMRVGGRRRVYAKPREGEGPTARCDVEVRLGGRPLFDW
uniref:peptidylprolyl isomerase n=1 Tax=Emiliania huxleyi TaxID=2903 RepID=A0A7S3TC24_EMIHU